MKRRLFNALAAASLAVMIFFAVALVCSRFGDPIWQFTVAGRFFCIHPFRNHLWLASVHTGPGKFPGFGQEHRLPRTTLVVLRCEPADPNGWSIGIEAGYPLLLVTSAALPIVWLTRFTVLRRRHREGCCEKCGYDLRATPLRCPECGTVPAIVAREFGNKGNPNNLKAAKSTSSESIFSVDE